MLASGCWILAAGCSILQALCSVRYALCPLSPVLYLLFSVLCPLSPVPCLLSSVLQPLQGRRQGFAVNFTGHVHRAFAVNRVPTGRIRDAVILDIQSDAHECFLHRQIQNTGGRFPGCAAGSALQDLDISYPAAGDLDPEDRFAECLAVLPQIDRPGQSASGRRRMDSPGSYFLAGCDQGDGRIAAQRRQIVAQIRVLQKIKHQIRVDGAGQVFRSVFNQGRQRIIDRYHLKLDMVPTVFAYPGNFALAAAVLLEDQYLLPFACLI